MKPGMSGTTDLGGRVAGLRVEGGPKLTDLDSLGDARFLRTSGRSQPRVDNDIFRSGQFISVAQSCPSLCNPMNCSTPGLPVHHQLLELA